METSGEIPNEHLNLEKLSYLNLKYNEFSGSIPIEIGNFNNMIGLSLSNNQFSGYIPVSICNLVENDCYLYINNNQLCSPYPQCIEEDVGFQDASECFECPDLPGDINNDGQVNINDIISVINCILSDSCNVCVDLNHDASIDIIDIILMIDYILGN